MKHRRTRRRLLQTTGVAAVAGLSGCLSTFTAETFDVGMTATAYQPAELTVAVGETVVWENTSSRRHTVTAYEELIPDDAEFFASGGFETEQAARDAFWDDFGGEIDTGDQFAHTFAEPGEYPYVCIPHERSDMVATIIVE